jgi:hypothetical protein
MPEKGLKYVVHETLVGESHIANAIGYLQELILAFMSVKISLGISKSFM